MAGETAKTEAVCIRISPWSRTSHIVSWYTPAGKVTTLVKGAMRPKSMFLGQYDLNYTCEIVHYLGGKGDMHPLRECSPLEGRERLRTDYRALLVAEHFREIVYELAPSGPDAEEWYGLLTRSLDELAAPGRIDAQNGLRTILVFELAALRLAGLDPQSATSPDGFLACGERRIPVSAQVTRCLCAPYLVKYTEILLEAVRITGIFWAYHLEDVPPTRRAAVQTVSATEQRGTQVR